MERCPAGLRQDGRRAAQPTLTAITAIFARIVSQTAIAAWSLVHGYAMLRLEGQLDGLPAEALPDTGAILAKLLPGSASAASSGQ